MTNPRGLDILFGKENMMSTRQGWINMCVETVRKHFFTEEKKCKGFQCPACDRRVKYDDRPINKTMAMGLKWLDGACGGNYIHIAHNIPNHLNSKQLTTLKHWGLVERGTPGHWRPTRLGYEFSKGTTPVHLRARIFHDRCEGLFGDKIYIDQLLEGFEYSDTMKPADSTAKLMRKNQ